jgi:hypothetical protein
VDVLVGDYDLEALVGQDLALRDVDLEHLVAVLVVGDLLHPEVRLHLRGVLQDYLLRLP